jgi:hypothetical protein
MELASMLADESFSDRPRNASPVIGAFLRTYNDGLDDRRRQDLYEFASLIVGSRSRRSVERDRASMCLEFACSLGARIPAGRAAVAVTSAEASGSWAALAALATGPSAEVHASALAFAHELIRFGRLAPRSRWARVLGRDPAAFGPPPSPDADDQPIAARARVNDSPAADRSGSAGPHRQDCVR